MRSPFVIGRHSQLIMGQDTGKHITKKLGAVELPCAPSQNVAGFAEVGYDNPWFAKGPHEQLYNWRVELNQSLPEIAEKIAIVSLPFPDVWYVAKKPLRGECFTWDAGCWMRQSCTTDKICRQQDYDRN